PGEVGLPPVALLLGRVEHLGGALAGIPTGHAADHRAGDRADGPARRADRRTRRPARQRPGARAHRVRARRLGDRVAVLLLPPARLLAVAARPVPLAAPAVVVTTMRHVRSSLPGTRACGEPRR